MHDGPCLCESYTFKSRFQDCSFNTHPPASDLTPAMQGSTASRQSPGSPWAAEFRPPQHGDVSYTPAGLPMQPSGFTGSAPSPFLFPGCVSDGSTTSPNYFGIVVDNASNPPGSNPGPHTKMNWDGLAQASSTLPSPMPQPVSPNPAQKRFFQLAGSNNHAAAADSTRNLTPHQPTPHMDTSTSPAMRTEDGFFSLAHKAGPQENSTQRNELAVDDSYFPITKAEPNKNTRAHSTSFGLPRTDSPDTINLGSESSGQSTNFLPGNSNLSLPEESPHASSPVEDSRRADTLPTSLGQDTTNFISAALCAELIQTASDKILLFDVRPFPQFSRSSIFDSLNLCIPTTLLKRPSFNTDKLKDTFISDSEKRKFSLWKSSVYIIVYDSNTDHPRDTLPLINVIKKFRSEGWHGDARILRGGFVNFAKRFPHLVREQRQNKGPTPAKQPRSMSLSLPSVAPVAGGCSLPNMSAANPFFSNIRQNMDLVGGVGQIAVKLPDTLTPAGNKLLPLWLRKASAAEDKGHDVSQTFLKIEERELHRMREALASNANYNEQSSTEFRVAGIEKGSKNRYNDIYPFEHSRVRLQDVPRGTCDYINASHVKAELSNKRYIATQAPVPATFEDFWRTIWEQNVRVVVALTAEVERGQVKCHPYWKPGEYGPFKVKVLGETRVFMDSKSNGSPTGSRDDSLERSPPPGSRSASEESRSTNEESPFIMVRHFTLLHSSYPFQPIREISQLQYSYWPDFGTTSQPNHLIKLVEQCNKITRKNNGLSLNIDDAEPPGQRPVLVHCSAGCGRTGTFCTVDSVLDTLKQQRRQQNQQDDSVDLIAKTVEDFRKQRPSMIQNLGQFVLCYESVLEWVVARTGATGG